MLTKEELPECPVATTVALIGSKWKLLIIRNLLERPWRFNELKKDLEGISQKVLTDSLRSMENDGLITRTVYPEVPPRVEYALSDLGKSLKPILAFFISAVSPMAIVAGLWIIIIATGLISTFVPAIAITEAAEAARPSIFTVTLPL